jgi:hypothetical protein
MKTDSVDKIISAYFAGVNTVPFAYKGKTFEPKMLVASPLLFRGFTCPSKCGGCCPRFSLDYLPIENNPYELTPRIIKINEREFEIYSDLQKERNQHFCRHLDINSGRCGIYQQRPFSCDFELIRFVHFPNRVILTQKLFSRGWAMKRVNGEQGALCSMIEITDHSINEVLRKLRRLVVWCDYFGINHRLAEVIEWVKTGPHIKPLILHKQYKR